MTDLKGYEFESDPDGIIWLISTLGEPVAYCKTHKVPLDMKYFTTDRDKLRCAYDGQVFILPNRLPAQTRLVSHLLQRETLKNLKVVRIDAQGSQILAREENKTDPRYFVTSKLSDTRKGLELMVQVGKREGGKKVQLFVDLPAHRLGFDQSDKDQHPTGIFSELKAQFKDSETIIKVKRPK